MKTSSIALTALAEYTGESYLLVLSYLIPQDIHIANGTKSIFKVILVGVLFVVLLDTLIAFQSSMPIPSSLLVFILFCFLTECDIRSCLNTLQFLHKKNETLSVVRI